MRLIVILLFAAILASLGSALAMLLKSKGDSKALARALTVRISLSVLLFLLLLVAWRVGLIQPHGIMPNPPSGTEAPAQPGN